MNIFMNDIVYNSLQQMRKENHMTQQEIADLVGVTRQTIIAIEKGNYTPSVLLALNIAQSFKQPVEKIFSTKKYDKK